MYQYVVKDKGVMLILFFTNYDVSSTLYLLRYLPKTCSQTVLTFDPFSYPDVKN